MRGERGGGVGGVFWRVCPVHLATSGVSWAASFSLSMFPCGFQVRAWHVIQVIDFERVYPPASLEDLISSSTGCCLVCFQSSLLLTVSGHRIRRILLRQVLMNVSHTPGGRQTANRSRWSSCCMQIRTGVHECLCGIQQVSIC